MNRPFAFLLLFVAILSAATDVSAADDTETQTLLAANRAFLSALAAHKSPAVANLLDNNFTWTDAHGVTLSRAQLVTKLPTPILPAANANAKGTDAPPKTHLYGAVGTVEATRGRVYVLQVWVKRPAGWRALVYQEVQALPAPAPGGGATASPDCDNPCKRVPFQPKTATERELIQSYQAVERAVTAHDATAWGSHIADEFFAVTSNSDMPLDKATRMAGLANQKQGGIAPFPLLSARMFAFGDTVVMTSKQQPVSGPPLRVTRVWIRRDARWLESISYQTTIQNPIQSPIPNR